MPKDCIPFVERVTALPFALLLLPFSLSIQGTAHDSRALPLIPVLCEQGSDVFAGKHGLITPRDLFRWASGEAVGYQQLAETGYMLLAERLRGASDRVTVQQVLEKVLNAKVRRLLASSTVFRP